MANTSSRTLRLLSLLQTRRDWPGEELAGRLGVSVRTLRRDVDRLRELGYPVEARRGTDGGYQLAAGAVLPPLLLDDEEAVALGVGLQAAVVSGTVAGIEESSVRALAKIVQVMPARLRRRVDALAAMVVPAQWDGPDTSVDPDDLTRIAQACRDSVRLEFAYTARDGRPSDRRVEPHRLVLLGGRWYLVAYDMARSDWRSFRLDRLTSTATTGSPFLPRALPGGDAGEFVRQGIDARPGRQEVELLVHAEAATVRSRIGRWATVEEDGTDRCVLRMSADSLDWAAFTVGVIGADVEVRSPVELAAHLRAWADRFARVGVLATEAGRHR